MEELEDRFIIEDIPSEIANAHVHVPLEKAYPHTSDDTPEATCSKRSTCMSKNRITTSSKAYNKKRKTLVKNIKLFCINFVHLFPHLST